MGILFEGRLFPLVPVGDRIAQPFTDRALPYLQRCINAYVGAAFLATMKGKVQGQPLDLACQDTGRADPFYRMAARTVRLPYLSISPEDGTTSEATLQFDQRITKYSLAYMLPALPEETIQDVALPLLDAVSCLLIALLKNGGDPAYQSGARVWEEAGIVAVKMGAYQFRAEQIGSDVRTAQTFPVLRAEVFVTGQEGFDASQFAPGFNAQSSLDVGGQDGVLPDAVVLNTTPGT